MLMVVIGTNTDLQTLSSLDLMKLMQVKYLLLMCRVAAAIHNHNLGKYVVPLPEDGAPIVAG
jgi:hypothetical protein